ncbi:MAG: exopolysaccharide production protein ExoQ [Frankiales bacterium]|nr:exopolysaccharide production protein ExoQ [Frankiales bacterium]
MVIVSHGAVALALAWWAFGLTHATGGRDPWALTLAMPSALLALAAVRPWRVLSARSLGLAGAVSLAPVLVCLIDPTHWFGADQAATYAYSAALFVTVRAYAVSSARRTAVLAVVLGAGMAQFAWSMIAWVGGGDPAAVMSGTFYWYNQYAAFLLAPAIIGAGVAALGSGQLRLAGTVTAALGSAGVILSTSRASMAQLGAGWIAAGLLAVLSRKGAKDRGLAGVRWLALAAVAAALTMTLPGPPFFAHRVAALASTAARNSQESVSQNGGFRMQFWQQALRIFGHHPLTGTGFGSFGRQSGLVDPHGAHSTLVHSGLIQPLSDGGLLLGAPFLLACALVGLGLLRRLLPSVWSADQGAVTLVALVALVVVVHSAVDFDWTYPSLMALSAILAGAALSWSPVPATEPAAAGSRTSAAGLVACVVLAAAAVVLAQQATRGGWKLSAPVPHPSALATTASITTSLPVTGEPAS